MTRLTSWILVSAAFVASSTSAAPPGHHHEEKLPTVAAVLNRFVEAIGGAEAMLRHRSMTIRGQLELFGGKRQMKSVFRSKDGKGRWRFVGPDGKAELIVYDGQKAWSIDRFNKTSFPGPDETRSIARDADMQYHLHVMKYFQSMNVVDVTTFNGRPCYHLKGINNWGKVNEQFYDTESGLLLGYACNTAWRGGRGDATVMFEDYQDFGGVRMAATTTSHDGDNVTVSRITSVTYDDVDDSIFVMPEQVRRAAEAPRRDPL